MNYKAGYLKLFNDVSRIREAVADKGTRCGREDIDLWLVAAQGEAEEMVIAPPAQTEEQTQQEQAHLIAALRRTWVGWLLCLLNDTPARQLIVNSGLHYLGLCGDKAVADCERAKLQEEEQRQLQQ